LFLIVLKIKYFGYLNNKKRNLVMGKVKSKRKERASNTCSRAKLLRREIFEVFEIKSTSITL